MNNKRAWLHSALIYWGVCVIVVGTASYALSQEADGTNCPSGVVGLCTPGTFESAIETVTETSKQVVLVQRQPQLPQLIPLQLP